MKVRNSRTAVGPLLVWWLISFSATTLTAQAPLAEKEVEDSEGLPPEAFLRLGSTRLRTAAQVGGLTFSPDGKLLAACGADGVVRLWEAGTAKLMRSFRAHPWGGKGLAFSPDGKYLAVGSTNSTTSVWDVETGKELQRFKHPRWVESAVFTRDSKAVAVGDQGGGVGLWDLATGKNLFQAKAHTGAAWVMAISPDGKTLASGSYDKSIRLLEVPTGNDRGTLQVERNGFTAVAFSPDSKTLLSGGHDGVVRFWDVESKKEVRTLLSNVPGSLVFALSSDGKTLVTANNTEKAFRVWDLVKREEVRRVEGPIMPPHHLALSPDGKIAATTGYYGTRVQLWDVATGKELFASEGHSGVLTKVFVTPDRKKAVTAGNDRIAILWDLATGAILGEFDGTRHQYFVTTVSADGKLLAMGGSERTVVVRDLDTGKETAEIPVGLGGVSRIVFTPSAKVLIGAVPVDSTIRLWDIATRAESRKLTGHTSCPFALAISQDGKLLASGGQDRTVRVWDLATGTERHRFDTETTVSHVALSPDGKLVTAGGSRRVRVWDTETGKERLSLVGHQGAGEGRVQGVAFSPDGKMLATSGVDRTVALWDVATGKALAPPLVQPDICNCLTFSADGKMLLSGSFDSSALVWNLEAWRGGSKVKKLDGKEMDALWGDLAGADPGTAHRAIWMLSGQEKVVAYLTERLTGRTLDDVETRIRRLITELDSNSFRTREKASRELTKLGSLAVPSLKDVLQKQPSLEVRRRVEELLKSVAPVQGEPLAGDLLRAVRVVHVLERVATPEAEKALRELAKGSTVSVARAAQESLRKLGRAAREGRSAE